MTIDDDPGVDNRVTITLTFTNPDAAILALRAGDWRSIAQEIDGRLLRAIKHEDRPAEVVKALGEIRADFADLLELAGLFLYD